MPQIYICSFPQRVKTDSQKLTYPHNKNTTQPYTSLTNKYLQNQGSQSATHKSESKNSHDKKNVALQICILLKQITIFVFFYFITFVQNITYESDTIYFHLHNFDLRVLLANKKRSGNKRPTRNDNRNELVGN